MGHKQTVGMSGKQASKRLLMADTRRPHQPLYLMSQSKATPRSTQCLGLKSVSKSMEPMYF